MIKSSYLFLYTVNSRFSLKYLGHLGMSNKNKSKNDNDNIDFRDVTRCHLKYKLYLLNGIDLDNIKLSS